MWRENFYDNLGLPNFSSEETVKKRYRELAIRHHPDRGGDECKMKQINHAYNALMQNKDRYDAWLRSQLEPAFEVILSTAFDGGTTSTTGVRFSWWRS